MKRCSDADIVYGRVDGWIKGNLNRLLQSIRRTRNTPSMLDEASDSREAYLAIFDTIFQLHRNLSAGEPEERLDFYDKDKIDSMIGELKTVDEIKKLRDKWMAKGKIR